MKKILALALALMMVLACVPAMASDVESAFDGTWVQFEDGFEIYLPSEWLELEVTEDMLASGIFYAVASPDGAYTCQLAWAGLEEELTIEQLQAELVATYPDAEMADFNDLPLVAYTDAENGMLAVVWMDTEEPGMYMCCFTPADEDTQAFAAVVATSIRYY